MRFRLPFDGQYVCTQKFGEHPEFYPSTGGHPGLDFATSEGTPVLAAASGHVMWVGAHPAWPGRGWYVVIDHGDGYETYSMHLSRVDALFGQWVDAGTQIGLSGGRPGHPGAGLSTGAHLHWDVRYKGEPVNPEGLLVLE